MFEGITSHSLRQMPLIFFRYLRSTNTVGTAKLMLVLKGV